MVTTKQTLAVAAIVAVAVAVTVGVVLFYTTTIHSSGIIRSVGIKVYDSSNLSREMTNVDWGRLDPGSNAYVDIWVQNTKNTPVTISINAGNFNPDKAQLYLTLISDANTKGALSPSGVVTIRLSLNVSPQIEGVDEFSFDVIITATETRQT